MKDSNYSSSSCCYICFFGKFTLLELSTYNLGIIIYMIRYVVDNVLFMTCIADDRGIPREKVA